MYASVSRIYLEPNTEPIRVKLDWDGGISVYYANDIHISMTRDEAIELRDGLDRVLAEARGTMTVTDATADTTKGGE